MSINACFSRLLAQRLAIGGITTCAFCFPFSPAVAYSQIDMEECLKEATLSTLKMGQDYTIEQLYSYCDCAMRMIEAGYGTSTSIKSCARRL